MPHGRLLRGPEDGTFQGALNPYVSRGNHGQPVSLTRRLQSFSQFYSSRVTLLPLRGLNPCPTTTSALLTDHPRLRFLYSRIPTELLDEFTTAPRHNAVTAASDVGVRVAFQQVDEQPISVHDWGLPWRLRAGSIAYI